MLQYRHEIAARAHEGLDLREAIRLFTMEPLTDGARPPVVDRPVQVCFRDFNGDVLHPSDLKLNAPTNGGPSAAEHLLAIVLLNQLRSGWLVAEGFIAPSLDLQPLPPEFWQRVDVDLIENSVEANEIRVTGVLIYRATKGLAEPAPEPAPNVDPRPTPVSARELEDWYRKRVASWPADQPAPSGPDDERDARQHFAGRTVTRERMRALRREFAPPVWEKRGRKKLAAG